MFDGRLWSTLQHEKIATIRYFYASSGWLRIRYAKLAKQSIAISSHPFNISAGRFFEDAIHSINYQNCIQSRALQENKCELVRS